MYVSVSKNFEIPNKGTCLAIVSVLKISWTSNLMEIKSFLKTRFSNIFERGLLLRS